MTQPTADSRPVFFIHLMKTGGTTLFEHFKTIHSVDEVWPHTDLDFSYDGPRLRVRHHLSLDYVASLPPERRATIRFYGGHLPYVARHLLGDVTTLTLLRDPVDRTVSLLRQMRRSVPGIQDSGRRPRLADAPLEEVYEHEAVFGPLVHNHQTKMFAIRAGEPYGFLDLLPLDAQRLADAKANLAEVDVVGVTERYDLFVSDVVAELGWTAEDLKTENVSPDDGTQVVSAAFRRRILDDNALDVELHRYALELALARPR